MKQSGQTRPQPEVAAVAFAERDVQLVKAADEIGRRVANPAGEIHLFASDAAPRPHQAAHGFEGLARIRQVHQDEPGVGEVERPFGEPRRVRVAHAKLDVRHPARFRLLSRLLDLRGTIIDSDNRTARPDFVGEPAGDIAAAAPDLDDAEAFPQARPTQKRLAIRPVNLLQQPQPLDLAASGRQDVTLGVPGHACELVGLGRTSARAIQKEATGGPLTELGPPAARLEENTPRRARTYNLRFRRPMLYPIELGVPRCNRLRQIILRPRSFSRRQ